MLRRKHVLQVAICIALVMVMVAGILQTSSAKAVTTTCTTYSGTNVEYQNYTTRSSPITSYLHYCTDGTIMRVQSGSSIDGILVEYYDTAYNIKSSKIVAKELPIFGGFYAMGGYYYLLTGQNNPNDSDSVEVFRITKYDTNWKKLGSASLYGANTYIPFDAGSARFASAGKYLLIRTAHEMYKSSDGLHHQANVTIQVDTSTMKITDSFTSVANVSAGYVSHSFNQFIQIEGNKIVAVDHGDAYPRSIVLTKYSKDVTTGTFSGGYNSVSATNLITFEGAIGANYTGASIGGFEISSTAYLVAGSQDIDASSNYTQGRNIFVAAQNKSTGAVTVNKITNYAAGSGTTSTPQMVKISNNNYLLLWSRGTTVYYTQIDGNGKQVGSIYSMAGNLSDCVPVLISGKLIWYTWNNGTITFYEIPVNNLASGKRTVIENGHKYQYGTTVTNGKVSRKCTECGLSETVTVPTYFYVWWRDKADTGSYWSSYSRWLISGTNQFPVGMEMLCWLDPESAQCNDMVAESSNSDVIAVGTSGTDKLLTMKKAGISVITLYPKYNPGIAKTYTMRVGANGSVNLSSCTASLSQTKYTYTGSAFTPTVTVKSGNVTLVENTDYTVAYSNNTNAGTATVTITGKGLFTGSIKKTFTIEPANISSAAVTLGTTSYTYDGTAKKPAVTVKVGSKTLTSGTDYTVTYSNNTNVGTATVTVTGKGNYTGTATTKPTFKINAASIAGATVTLGTTSYTYDGTAKKPTVTVKVGSKTLTSGTDYTVSYSNNTNAGTATVTVTGTGNYTGTATTKPTFKINAASIAEAAVTLGTTSYTYDGTAKKPAVTVKVGSKTLTSGTDYTVSYSNNTNAGTATVTVTGKGNYTGTATTKPTFKINAASITGATVTLGTTSYDCDNTEKKPSITVVVGSRTLTNGTDYTVTYSDNIKAGIATVKITGKDNYSGSVSKTFEILPAVVKNLKTTPGNKSITVSWDPAPGATGYRVYRYDTSQKKWVKIATVTSCSYKDTGLTAGATYTYAVRSYSTVSGKTYVSRSYPKKKGIANLNNVSGFSATSGEDKVKISWNKVENATGYRVYRYNATKKKWERIATTTKTTYTDTGRKSGTKYFYTVRAYKVVEGTTYLSPSYSIFKTSTNPAPVNFKVTAGSQKATVSWNKVSGATGYRVYYKTSSSGSWKKLTGTTATSYTKTGLTKGKTYYFTVRAVRTYNGKKYLSTYSAKSVTVK